MSAQYPTYEVFIDWDNDGGLRVSDFEQTTDGWSGEGTTPPLLSLSTEVESFSGTSTMKIEWVAYNPFTFDSEDAGFDEGRFGVGGQENVSPFTFDDTDLGFDEGRFGYNSGSGGEEIAPYVSYTLPGLRPGRQYTLSLWAYVPVGGLALHAEIEGNESSTSTTANEMWTELIIDFVASATSHVLRLEPDGEPAGGELAYLDYVFITGEFEDITEEVLAKRSPVSFEYGRNTSRSLGPVEPSETSLEVFNPDGKYSLGNESSPLEDYLLPGREILFRAKYENRAYDLYRGFFDDMTIDPETGKESITFACVDALHKMGGEILSTEVHKGLRTGDAINLVLDYVGWPEHRRDIDAGASVIAWWWEEGVTAADALKKIVETEGGPAYTSVSPSGDFMFRDRHHRLLNSGSTTSQATIVATGAEPLFSPPMDINVGFKDMINYAEFEVQPTSTALEYANNKFPVVWETDETFTLGAGDVKTFDIVANSAFINAQTPLTGQSAGEEDLDDYEVVSGAVEVSIGRTSGVTTKINVQCTSGPAVIKGMKLRASPLNQADAVKVHAEDTGSIGRVGKTSSEGLESGWANLNDAKAMADVIVGIRANRLPTVSITLHNASAERMTQMLQRDLSDRIHISEARSFTDHDFYIESIGHEISEAGKFHTTTFGCERVPTYAAAPFRFDDGDSGFDEGVFGYDGLSEPETLFVLDQSNLDEGLLGL